ncbi:hypothetical protein IQ62_21515 [Streptomyces scabiei]|nr:hypothetical protein IQ62_21515 [Streptomyces scabiei]
MVVGLEAEVETGSAGSFCRTWPRRTGHARLRQNRADELRRHQREFGRHMPARAGGPASAVADIERPKVICDSRCRPWSLPRRYPNKRRWISRR